MEPVELIVLNDNEPGPGLYNDWGWSLYIKAHGREVLFDADTKYIVLEYNIQRLNIEIEKLEFAVLSHWHRDHYGGFPAIAQAKPGLKVYVPPGPLPKLKRLGLDPVPVTEEVRENGFIILKPLYVPLLDLYELSLLVESPKGYILVVGCSHPGIDRIVEHAIESTGEKLFMVIGGFHQPSTDMLDKVAKLVEGPICASHCSGEEAKEYIRIKYPNKSCNIRTGSRIIIT